MKFFRPCLLALSCVSIGTADRAIHNGTHADSAGINHWKHDTSGSEGSMNDLTSIVSQLADRIKDLEDSSRTDKQIIHNLGDVVLYLESKVDELEETIKKGREEISSLNNEVHAVEQRNLQLFNGPLMNRGRDSSDSNDSSSDTNDSPCMPRYVNNRCVFGGTPDVVAIRFENATFFNDNVEFNENVGFDEDADCMPRYNRTSNQCVLSDNFKFDSGTYQFEGQTRVTFRSREVWIRPKKTYFRNTNTSFRGGALEIGDDVDVIE